MAGSEPTRVWRPGSRLLRTLATAAPWLLALAFLVCLLGAGWLLMFSTFMDYDDEGYVLLSLRNFADGGALYDQLYTQYGPFFYLLADALHGLLRFDWNSTSARLFALACWLGSAASCAALVARRTKAFAYGVFTFAATFVYLVVDIYEPSHPGSMIVLLVAIAAWIGAEAEISQRAAPASAIGAIGAALALTKANVGGLLLISALAWLLLRTTWVSERRGVFVGQCLALATLPWLLMRPLISDAAVFQFAANTSLAVLSVMIAARTTARPIATRRACAAFVLSAAAVSSVTVGLIMMRGTTLHGLLSGVLLAPLQHPFVEFLPVRWSQGSAYCAGAAVVLAAWACQSAPPRAVAHVVALLRLLAAIAIAYFAVTSASEIADVGLSYGVGIAGLCALPLRFDAEGVADARARQWLALLLVLQSLHAFPTAGSQISWGSFLIVPLVSLAVRDAWIAVVSERWGVRRHLSWGTTLVLVGVSALIGAQMLSYAQRQYQSGVPLDLPGAQRISLAPPLVLTLRTLVENARVHAGLLFSGPGMYSFNLWAERPAPTMANATLWPALLEPKAEQDIIARLREDPRAVVIERSNFRGYGALHQYLERGFHPAFELNGYRFLVHEERQITRVSSGRMRQEDAGTLVLDLTLARSSQPITLLEIRPLDAPSAPPLFRLQQATATIEATALSEDGQPSGPTQTRSWPVQLRDPITLLRIRFAGQAPPAGTWVANVFSREGRIAMAAIGQ